MAGHDPAVLVARLLRDSPPASGAVVMGTGIVSIALSLDGRETLSRTLLVICAVAWVVLGVVVGARLGRDRDRVERDARSPAGLTGVAGTAVLATGLAMLGWDWASVVLLIAALLLWMALLSPVLAHWMLPTTGVSLVLAVSTESLAVLSAEIAETDKTRWLLVPALVALVLGLAFYVFTIARFDLGQLAVGRGDQWITGGALAISTLAAARITLTAKTLHTFTGALGALKVGTGALWGLSIAWIPVLVLAEALRPRWGYDVRRWATVFPLGMYAACSFLTGSADSASGIIDFARVCVWVAVAVWLLVFLGMLGCGAELVREPGRARNPSEPV